MHYDDDDEITPARAIIAGFRWLPVWVLAIGALLVGGGILTLILWGAGVWFGNRDVNIQYQRTVHGQGYQSALVAQMETHLSNISGAGGLAATRASLPAGSAEQQTLRSQELSELRAFCSEAADLISGNPSARSLLPAVRRNCAAGSPVAQPPLASPVPQ